METTIENNIIYKNQMLFNPEDHYSIPKGDITFTVERLVKKLHLTKYCASKARDFYGYPADRLLAVCLLGFTLDGYISTRKLAEKCRFDARFRYLMDDDCPSHMTFQRFISEDLSTGIQEIFYELNKYIAEDDKDNIDTSVLFIDGTKFEANATKFSFIWGKNANRYFTSNWKKFIELLDKLNVYLKESGKGDPIVFTRVKVPDIPEMLRIAELIEKLVEDNEIEFVHGIGKRKQKLQKFYEEYREICLKLINYELQLDLLDGHNSCSITDPESSFMHAKYDYYCNTGVFKPCQNVQLGVSSGYIRHIYVSRDANDLRTYIPFMEGYFEHYGEYPEKTPADAGYGSYDNYTFAQEKGIELFMKYPTYHKEQKRVTEKTRYLQRNFRRDEEGNIYCPAGHKFMTVSVRTQHSGVYDKKIDLMETGKCATCPLRSKCTKAKSGVRRISVCQENEKQKEIVRANLGSEDGKELMKQRSIQSEGTFGQIKQDIGYDRLVRRGKAGSELEIYLVSIGHNLRHYHKNITKAAAESEKMYHQALCTLNKINTTLSAAGLNLAFN